MKKEFELAYDVDAPEEFNCMGFAFGIRDWLEVYGNRKDLNSFFIEAKESLEKKYPYAISVKSEDVVNNTLSLKDYTLIAMKVGMDESGWSDFHFMRQERGQWYEKFGGLFGVYRFLGNIFGDWSRQGDEKKYNSKTAFYLIPNKNLGTEV